MSNKFPYLFTSLFFLFFINSFSQVGIGTTTPNASSILDIESTTQGILAPRMTTAQRIAIASPAEGLLVFDINESVFYFYDGGSWLPLEGTASRDNYKLIKSDADLATELANGSGTEYLLDTNTLYEINGTINLAVPINLNNAYLFGEDTNEDILVGAGTIFSGTSGGSIRGVTLVAPVGNVFNLIGTGAERLVFRDSVVANSSSVGSISDFNLVFVSIVQFINNANGIIYTDINQLLLNSMGWDSTNGGVYETFVGDFDVITKQGGFCNVTTATAAVDVTGVGTISGGAAMRIVDFYGGGNYINGSSPYTGYNFTNDWDVDCPGIEVETDGVATGDINLNYAIGFGALTTFSGTGTGSRIKLNGDTASNNLFRFTVPGAPTYNRLVYDGKKTRYFNISTSLSFRGSSNNNIFVFYLAKNGVVIDQTRVYREIGGNNDIGAVPIVASLLMAPGDYIEVWAERYSGGGNLLTISLNLTAQ
ncbi:hypothetical protein MBM09_07565 [Flaviramulus sp. BrNp1-15]|uniref:hypothetical protein n=1 Tax=Flaviramulus sp. BrNp1-15 TaxID=2916754 RepID=UPI001EE7A7E1|nr:hypothetical protein [Flaviramulus sp. BrNp1-15]ULC60848.1 hypothetical protein MBM09_07565 [Flaviramulus sp. BrNp1-15]